MTPSIKFLPFYVLLIVFLHSCNTKVKTAVITQKGPIKIKVTETLNNCHCDSLWNTPKTKAFVEALEETTGFDYTIWKDYNINQGNYVLNAGKNSDSLYCLGLWKAGTKISEFCSQDVPKMLTPLYSYYLNYDNVIRMDSLFFQVAADSPEFTSWMKANSVKAAVFMPTVFPDFPFEIPAKTKTQLAVHETFHIEVMLKYWYTGKGYWPSWDKQPDRAAIISCYTNSVPVEKLISEEQEILVRILEALLAGDKRNAIIYGNQFLSTRELRYSHLKQVAIDLKTGKMGDCQTAEAIMEIEEGLADYASWSVMYEMGFFSKEELLKRYKALQKDKYYLTGAMLMHAMHLMNGSADDIIDKIVNADSVATGNLTTLFKTTFDAYKTSKPE